MQEKSPINTYFYVEVWSGGIQKKPLRHHDEMAS